MKIYVTLVAMLFSVLGWGQTELGLKETSRKFMQSGDFKNAILVLKKALDTDKNNLDLQKELVFAYYYSKDYAKAKDILKPILSNPAADMQFYQLAGSVYKLSESQKEIEKFYKNALKKFPTAGPLYNEYGEYLEQLQKSDDAIKIWEKGLQMAPSYSGNYYNASMYYFKKPDDKIWAILYGEIYANMESMNPKSDIAKKMVLDAYKQKLFVTNDLNKDAAINKNPFAKAVLETFAKQAIISTEGLTPETLAMIRTRFILDWFTNYGEKFPFKLFEFHQQTMKEGLFDAYNQWMFGPVADRAAFENWASTHEEEYTNFTNFHRSRIFKMPTGQTYSAQ